MNAAQLHFVELETIINPMNQRPQIRTAVFFVAFIATIFFPLVAPEVVPASRVDSVFSPSAYSSIKWDNKDRVFLNCMQAQVGSVEITDMTNDHRVYAFQTTRMCTLPEFPDGVALYLE